MFSLRFSRPCVQKHVRARRLLSGASLPTPDKPKGWPTPWITEDDATNFLFPLYHHGWYITTVQNHPVRTAGLACHFDFRDFVLAAAFTKDIFALTEAESHHPCWLKMQHSTDGTSIHVCSTTHSALRPAWDPVDTPDSRALEGLTLRDLRFAALISTLSTSSSQPNLHIKPSPQRPAWDDFCATLRTWSTPKTTKTKATCPACAGEHAISACPTRHSLTPPPCTICKGLHWRIDCPVHKAAVRTGLTISQIRRKKSNFSDGSYEPPPKPCPNCGGAHWKADCRVPHAPPELLQRLALPVPEPELASQSISEEVTLGTEPQAPNRDREV